LIKNFNDAPPLRIPTPRHRPTRPNLRPAPKDPTWSIVSGFKGLENDVVILAALTDIETG